MTVAYANNGKGLRYLCARLALDYAEPRCQTLCGPPLEELVAELVLAALAPAALELSLSAAADLESERQALHHHWQQRLERAEYEAQRAARQYQAVEPEHRLVTRTLEQQWEAALREQQRLQEESARFRVSTPLPLSTEERERIRSLAADIPALWHALTTTPMERQAIVRQLVEQVVETVEGQTEKVDVHIRWAGGHQTHARVTCA